MIYFKSDNGLIPNDVLDLIERTADNAVLFYNGVEYFKSSIEAVYHKKFNLTDDERTVTLNQNEKAMLNKIHWTWFLELKFFINSLNFTRITDSVYETRKKRKVFPDQSKVWKPFEKSLNDIKVVVIGQDPYTTIINGYEQATGLAFECYHGEQPSLKLMREAFIRETGEFKGIKTLADEGWLFLNSSLTDGHQELWKPFITEVINILNRRQDLIFLFVGKEAQKHLDKVNKNFYIYCVEHPAAASYNNREWITDGKLKKICETLL